MADYSNTLKIIERRRSIYPKNYENNEVSDADLAKLIDAAKWAPTHKNTQPWFFIVLKNESKRQLVRKQIELLFAEKGENQENKAKAQKMYDNAELSAAIIAIVMKRDSLSRIPQHEEEWAVACAVQNMHLLAPSLSLGCYWSTGGNTNHKEIRLFLELDENDLHMGWFFVGSFSKEIDLAKPRQDWDAYSIWRN